MPTPKVPPAHPGRAGSPPAGSVGEDAIERLVSQWLSRPKPPADCARIPRAALLDETQYVLEGRADLEAFAAAAAPIKGAAFDYLEVLQRMTLAEPAEKVTKSSAKLPHNAATEKALKEATAALVAVLTRAEACGRPLRLYELARPPWSADGFITQLLHVVLAGRRRAEKWDDPVHAAGMFTRLETAALTLEHAWKLAPSAVPAQATAQRAMALHRLLFDAVTYLSAYGRTVFPTGEKSRARYLLSHLFPAKAPAGLTAPLKLTKLYG